MTAKDMPSEFQTGFGRNCSIILLYSILYSIDICIRMARRARRALRYGLCQENGLETVFKQSSERLVALETVLRWLETVLRWLETVLNRLEEVLNMDI